MKPKNFKPPYRWEDRRVMIHHGVLCVPAHYNEYDSFQFPGWDAPTIFCSQQPVHVEYCSGNGTWIAEKAQQHPDRNWVAVEIRYDRVRKIWSKIQNLQLPNLFCIWGEAHTITKHYFPDDSVAQVYINFPDPWPKKRHHKHRLMKPAFVEEVCRSLQQDGLFTLVTDDVEYSELGIEALRGYDGLDSLYGSPYFVDDLPGYGSSYFDTLWRGHGKQIRYHQFRKQALVTHG